MIDSYNSDNIIKMISYTDEDINKAKDYVSRSLKTILYPVTDLTELERMYNEYLAMPKHSRFESDEECRNIFKCNNRDLYTLIKADILKKDGGNKLEPTLQQRSLPEQVLFSNKELNPLDEDAIEMYKPMDFVQDVAKKNALKLGYFKPNTDYKCPDAETPYFTSVEIIANKAEYKDVPDGYFVLMTGYTTYKEWFDGLQSVEHGYITEEYQKQVPIWIETVRRAYNTYLKDKSKLSEYVLVSLGWNPLMEFNAENRVKATNRFYSYIHESINYDIIDISADLLIESNALIDPIKKGALYPIFIVLAEGKTFFSDITKKVTKGPFSHAAIAMDETLDNMYSFNMLTPDGRNGLSIESIKGYPQNNKLGVFAIFVKEQEWHTIKSMLEYYIKNIEKTSYSILNILALPFNKAIKMDFSMICSEFVDNLLKICNISLVDKDSPLVTPNDLYRASTKNKKIYKIYEGTVDGYKEHAARSKVFKLLNNSKYIKEACLFEMKEFPVQFSNEGDLLIHNMRKLNYEEEYSKSHRLLLAYAKAKNIDSMKYELCKLWFLNQLLERDIYSGKNAIANSKCRSRVLNDFNTYLDKVLEYDKGFNFSSYYGSTPFSDAVIKINGSTLKYSLDFVKQVLRPMV